MTRSHVSPYAPPLDLYAHARCACKHLIYADQKPGDRCLWAIEGLCGCTEHRPVGEAVDRDGSSTQNAA